MRRGFAALAHYVDGKLGELLDVLDETGLDANTLVIFTSDHGEMLGEKGLIQKRSLYEWSARIPMLVAGPNISPGTVGTPISLIDIPATLLDIASVEPVAPLDGRSLLPALSGHEIDVIPIVSEYHGEGIMRPCFLVRKGPWKLIYVHRSDPQLFNLDDDPDEWNNLAGRPEHQVVQAELTDVVIGGTFDLDFIEKDMWARLPLKQVVNEAMAKTRTHWDYIPDGNAAGKYVRT